MTTQRRSIPLLLAGCGVSLLGDGMFAVALGFAVFALGGGALTLGALLLTGTLAIFLTILPAGALADRMDRRWLVIGSDIARGAAQLTSAALVTLDRGHAWHLILPAIVFGIATGVHQPATQAFIGDVVPPERLDRINGMIQALRGVGMVTGAALAGFLVAHGSVAGVVALDGCTFLACAACVFGVRAHRTVGATVDGAGTRQQIAAGFALVRSTPWLRRGTLTAATLVLTVYAPMQVVGPLASRDSGGPAQWGTIATALAVGVVLGGVTVSLGVASRVHLLVRALLITGAAGPVILAVASGTPRLIGALLGFAALGAAMGCYFAGWEARKQRDVSSAALARIGSIDWLCSLVCMMSGVAIASIVSASLGSDAMLLVMAGGCVAVGSFVTAPPRRTSSRSEPNAPRRRGSPRDASTPSTVSGTP
jgi:MFS family permease